MQTNFSDVQRKQARVRDAESILRKCVHCGFCTATCPTYVLLGDELDSPRGRIYLIKDMLESDLAPSANVVKHIDRCLSCLGCMTTCPSDVNYMHLVDQGRAHIEARHRRPVADRIQRALLAFLLPYPARFRAAMVAARLARPFRKLLPSRLRAMVEAAPKQLSIFPKKTPSPSPVPDNTGGPRVALSLGCVQQIMGAHINRAAERLLRRIGCEVVVAPGTACCGALTHHLGKPSDAWVRTNVAAWARELKGAGLDAIVITASGCGTMVKDYGYLLSEEEEWADVARKVSDLAQDITETVSGLGLPPLTGRQSLRVAYQDACSLAHGQQVRDEPRNLLREAGFDVIEVPEGHLCCGSAGTYNVLQSNLAEQLGARKILNLESVSPDVIAVGNIGCINQISARTKIPVVHTVELLDWATGGPRPEALESFRP